MKTIIKKKTIMLLFLSIFTFQNVYVLYYPYWIKIWTIWTSHTYVWNKKNRGF